MLHTSCLCGLRGHWAALLVELGEKARSSSQRKGVGQCLTQLGKACWKQRKGLDVLWSTILPGGFSAACGSKNKLGPGCVPIIFPHFELGLILTSDDKDPNNGNLFGEE